MPSHEVIIVLTIPEAQMLTAMLRQKPKNDKPEFANLRNELIEWLRPAWLQKVQGTDNDNDELV